MVARFRSWWQQIKQHRVAIGVIGVALVVVISLIISVVWFNGTGFDGYNQVTTAHTISGPSAGTVVRTEVYQPGKSLWDWMQLLIIPAVLAVGGYIFNLTVSRNEQKAVERRDQTEHEIAEDNQREAALQAYIDKMSELLLKEHLDELTPEGKLKPEYEEIRKIARVRTLTILPRLDANRKRSVLEFLYESGLIDKNKSIVNLQGANLHDAYLDGTNLNCVNLRGADLSNATLRYADLDGADLRDAYLGGTDLNCVNLRGADLSNALLSGARLIGSRTHKSKSGSTSSALMQFGPGKIQANLSEADLSYANLSEAVLVQVDLNHANLNYANLDRANLNYANLDGAELNYANLDGAELRDADLTKADLTDAKCITIEELEKQAKSLSGATMPDGSTHA